MKPKQTIAVVGAGLAGLTTAWLLKDKYQVTLFESHPKVGMGVFTQDYSSNGIDTRIDIPLRIFTPGYYPELFKLYAHLGIEMEDSDHSSVFQYSGANNKLIPFFQYSNFVWSKKENSLRKFSYLKSNSVNLRGLKTLTQYYRFFSKAKKSLAAAELSHELGKLSFGEYVQQNKLDNTFLNHLLIPALCVTCTCTPQDILNYPSIVILEYLTCGLMKDGIVRAKLGVDAVVPKLTSGYEVICNAQVESIEQTDHDNLKLIINQSNNILEQEFDYAVLATPAHIAQSILNSQPNNTAENQISEALKQIPICYSDMTLHTDDKIVFNAKQASPVSYIIDPSTNISSTSVNLAQAFSTYEKQENVYQTWSLNDDILNHISKDKILATASFSRPLVTLNSLEAVKRIQQLNSESRIKIAGSYMTEKIPLLDAAATSAINIAKLFDCPAPWLK